MQKKLLAMTLALLMAAVLLAACAKGDSPPANTDAATQPADTQDGTARATEPAGAGEPKILKVGESGFEGKFIPILHDKAADSRVDNIVFESLMQVDATGSFYPQLASRMDVSADSLTITFTLREGITFSDGMPLTAADVEFTYKTIAHADYNGSRAYVVNTLVGYEAFHSGQTEEFAGISVIDDHTIAFTFEPGNASPVNVEFFNFGIMPQHYYAFETWDDLLDKLSAPLGSGPMVLEDYQPKQYIRLTRNENYWDRDNLPRLDGVLIQEVPAETMLGALQTAQVDLGTLESTLENIQLLESLPGVEHYVHSVNGYTFLYFNCVNSILEDVLLRQALTYALDRKAFIQAEYGGFADLGYGPIGPASWAGSTAGMKDYDFDLETAAALIAEAGWTKGANGILEKDGQPFTIRWLTYTEAPWTSTIAAMAADSWGQLGVDLKIEQMDQSTVISKTIGGEPGEKDFDVATLAITLGVDPDPSGGVFDYDAYSAGGLCASGYYNQRAQELIQLGRGEFDQNKRAEYYHEWNTIMNDQLPTLIITYRNSLWGINSRVTGLNISAYTNWSHNIAGVDIS